MLVMGLAVGTASAQLGSGIVYDPTNYHNALLRYYQLQQHLLQLQKSYAKITSQLNLAMQMATFVRGPCPAVPRGVPSEECDLILNTFGNNLGGLGLAASTPVCFPTSTCVTEVHNPTAPVQRGPLSGGSFGRNVGHLQAR